MRSYNWPLNVNNFSLLDKIKICSFILNPKSRWTQDSRVKDFENKFSKFVGSKYSIFVSSGSTANTLISMYLKDKKVQKNKNIVIFPSTTWITSVSPFLREGFTPKFIDVSTQDFCMDLDLLEVYLSQFSDRVACVFVTSLLGFVPDIERLKTISDSYNVKIMMDNCENTFGTFKGENVSKTFTSTTSTYFGHQIQSVEGGFVFTNSEEEYEYFLMARNHGMVRSLSNNKDKYSNKLVDPRFDFNILGNNFRNSDINAFIGSLDFERVPEYISKRKLLYNVFSSKLSNKYILPKIFSEREYVAFALPIICPDKTLKSKVLDYCEKSGIESRPVISGNLLRQTCLQNYENFRDFPVSEMLNENGMYVGLHCKLSEKNVEKLVKNLNSI